jgi:hypothetical protein
MHLVSIRKTALPLAGDIGPGCATGVEAASEGARTTLADIGAGRLNGSGAAFEAVGSAAHAIRREIFDLVPTGSYTRISSDNGTADEPAAIGCRTLRTARAAVGSSAKPIRSPRSRGPSRMVAGPK